MPFDGAQFGRRPQPPRRPRPSDNAVCTLIIVVAFSLLVLPISLGALVDIVRFVHGR